MTYCPEQWLNISAASLRSADLETRLDAAAAAGFNGIGLRLQDYRGARREGMSDERVAGMITDYGLEVVELETVWDWVSANDSAAQAHSDQEKTCFELPGFWAADK